MKKNLGIIFLIIFVVLVTAFVTIQKPTIHKQAIITDSSYKFVEEKNPFVNASLSVTQQETVDIKPELKITTTEKTTTSSSPKINVVEKPKSESTIKIVEQKTPVQNTKQNTVTNKTPQTKVTTNKKIETVTQKPEKETNVEKKVQEKPVTQNITNVQQEPKPEKTPVPKTLTESEEIIAWNKWRSDLQNQVMKDTKIGAPIGTGFRFSFTVDKYGNMSNIKVWSTNPVYTDLAVRVIKPVLNNYQRKSILNFPQGTKRVITNVTGGFVISTKTEFSTPSDYSDYEKVKRTQYK